LRIEVELVILFCDTSALLKHFIDEEGSDGILRARADCTAIGMCRITWAESIDVCLFRPSPQPGRPVASAGGDPVTHVATITSDLDPLDQLVVGHRALN
jgi:hypothetical protein